MQVVFAICVFVISIDMAFSNNKDRSSTLLIDCRKVRQDQLKLCPRELAIHQVVISCCLTASERSEKNGMSKGEVLYQIISDTVFLDWPLKNLLSRFCEEKNPNLKHNILLDIFLSWTVDFTSGPKNDEFQSTPDHRRPIKQDEETIDEAVVMKTNLNLNGDELQSPVAEPDPDYVLKTFASHFITTPTSTLVFQEEDGDFETEFESDKK